MSSEQSKLFSFWILIGFDKKWAISIQGHILRDFVLKSIRNEQYPAKARFLYFHGIWWGMSTTQSKLFSYWFLILFIEKWAISRQGYILEDFVLKSIRNELYPSNDSFWRFYEWIWWEMSSEQSKACCYWFLNVSNENWAVSSQDNNLKDFSFTLTRSALYQWKTRFSKFSYWIVWQMSYEQSKLFSLIS